MRTLIDRSRWPVLVTYHDEGQGHTGHVYRCSGWEATARHKRPIYEDAAGTRKSPYSAGQHVGANMIRVGSTIIQRWEHWACPRGGAARHMAAAGWRRVPIPGRTWRSGAQAYTWRNLTEGLI